VTLTAQAASKQAGERVESELVQRVPGLRAHSGDHWHDATADAVICPRVAPGLDYHTPLVEPGTPIEIKAAQIELPEGRCGRWHVRRGQHERLLDAAAAYVLAVYIPHGRVVAAAVVPATRLDERLRETGDWVDAPADRSTDAYRQLAWSHYLDPERVREDADAE
jgi:hypothetical protein